MTALLASVWAFQAVVNVPFANQYLLPVAGSVAVLAALGWSELDARAPARLVRVTTAVVALVAGVGLAVGPQGCPTSQTLAFTASFATPDSRRRTGRCR